MALSTYNRTQHCFFFLHYLTKLFIYYVTSGQRIHVSPVKHISVIKGNYYNAYKCYTSNGNNAFLLLSSLCERSASKKRCKSVSFSLTVSFRCIIFYPTLVRALTRGNSHKGLT